MILEWSLNIRAASGAVSDLQDAVKGYRDVGDRRAIRSMARIAQRTFSGFCLGLILGCIGFLRIALWQSLHIFD